MRNELCKRGIRCGETTPPCTENYTYPEERKCPYIDKDYDFGEEE